MLWIRCLGRDNLANFCTRLCLPEKRSRPSHVGLPAWPAADLPYRAPHASDSDTDDEVRLGQHRIVVDNGPVLRRHLVDKGGVSGLGLAVLRCMRHRLVGIRNTLGTRWVDLREACGRPVVQALLLHVVAGHVLGGRPVTGVVRSAGDVEVARRAG
jgi:hypothetical protein